MTAARLHLLAQAALCYEQAGVWLAAARCREQTGELVAAGALFRHGGELTRAASCYDRAGHTAEAASCLLALGRPRDAADLWLRAGRPVESAWVLAVDARQPQQARAVLADLDAPAPAAPAGTPGAFAVSVRAEAGLGDELRLRLAKGVCSALERHPEPLVAVLHEVAERLPAVTPASDQERLVRWAVQAADHLQRPDLASAVFGAAYRCRLRGTTARWREWAKAALGGAAGIPERDL